MKIGLRTKLVLWSTLLVIFTLVLTSSVIYYEIKNDLVREIKLRGIALTQNLATNSCKPLLLDNDLLLNYFVNQVKEKNKDVVYAMVINIKNEIIASTDSSNLGNLYQSPFKKMQEDLSVQKYKRGKKILYDSVASIMYNDSKIGKVHLGISEENIIRAKKTILIKILVISFSVLIFGIIGSLILARFFLTPLKKLVKGVESISSGELKQSIETITLDEFGELTLAFNKMSNKLLENQDELNKTNKELKKVCKDIEEEYREMIKTFGFIIDIHDNYLKDHSFRVAELCKKFAAEFNFSKKKINLIYYGGLLHDIGHIGIDKNILNKPGKLTLEEYEMVKKHCIIGEQIIDKVHFLKDVKPLIKYHHEWYNGQGYPDGLKGDEIPLEIKILSVVNVYDVLLLIRPYRNALTYEEAIIELKRCSGTQFDPMVIDAFLVFLEKQRKKE